MHRYRRNAMLDICKEQPVGTDKGPDVATSPSASPAPDSWAHCDSSNPLLASSERVAYGPPKCLLRAMVARHCLAEPHKFT